jgi:hypothetical protein
MTAAPSALDSSREKKQGEREDLRGRGDEDSECEDPRAWLGETEEEYGSTCSEEGRRRYCCCCG